MSVRTIFLGVGLISLFAVQSVWAQEIVVRVDDKQNNSTGLQAEIDEWFNLADCQDNIEITFEVRVPVVQNTDTLYLFEGSSCDSDPSKCIELGSLDRASTSAVTGVFVVELQDIFPSKADCEETRDDQSETQIWAAVLEDSQQADPGDWSEPLEVTLDLFPPPAATDVEAQFGEESITVTWDADADDLTHPLDGVEEETDTDTDSDTETDGTSTTSPSDVEVAGQFYVLYESCGEATVGDSNDDTDTTPTLPLDTGGDSGSGDGDAAVDCVALCTGVGFEAGDTDFLQYSFEETDGSARKKTIKGLTNGTAYKTAVVSFDAFINPAEISTWDCAIPNETISFFDAYAEAGGKGAGNFCFVATAAFGSYDHPTVQVLRRFRDGFLSEIVGGKQLIQFYYAVGPTLAGLLDGRPRLAGGTRGVLGAFAPLAAGLTKMGPVPFNLGLLLLCCGSVVAIVVVRRRRRG